MTDKTTLVRKVMYVVRFMSEERGVVETLHPDLNDATTRIYDYVKLFGHEDHFRVELTVEIRGRQVTALPFPPKELHSAN